MNRKSRVFVFLASALMLVAIAASLWARLGPLGPSVSRALASNGNYSPGTENEKEADHPFEAAAFRELSLVDENGKVPADGLLKGKAHIEAMLEAQKQSSSRNEALAANSWTWLGPGNVGGRIRSIVIHPTTPNTMWVGSVSGGIWKTTDGGASWQIQTDFLTNMAVASMVIDPTNPNILYAGTGEKVSSYNVFNRGNGIFKTTDGGTTWTQLANTADNTEFWYVSRLAISPADHNILLAATYYGIYRSLNGGVDWTQETDFGGCCDGMDVDFNPSDGTKAVAGTLQGGAWYSTNSGDTWTMATGLPGSGRAELAYARSLPSTVYASVNSNGGELYVSVDGGASYALAYTGTDLLSGQGDYDNIVWVDPTNVNNVIVGGVDLYRTTTGGLGGFTQISDWRHQPFYGAGDSMHADHHMIVEHPQFNGAANKVVFFAGDGGIYRNNDFSTADIHVGWTELNNTLGITQFYGAAGSPTTGTIIGGTQDNGSLLYTTAGGTEGWTQPYGGDGGWSAADPTDPNYLYGEYVTAQIHRNSTGGAGYSEDIWGRYWDGFSYQFKPAPYTLTDAQTGAANFIAPFILDPNNANRLLVGASSLWRTNDVKTVNTTTTGPAWTAIKPPAASYISAIAVAQGNSDIVWVGHNNGDVYMTTNGTAVSPTWTKVDDNAPGLPNRYVTRIAIDKNNHSKVFVTFGGFSADNLYVTTNGGTTWADSTGTGLTGLADIPLRTIVIHPSDSNKVYVGAEIGIFESTDGGASWNVSSKAPTNTAVDELFWLNTTLVAATHGRGIFKQDTLTQTFSDVGTGYWAYSYIERLFSSGITSGCAAGLYCPEDSVTRAQMAVFLEKGIHGAAFVAPNVAPTFGDTAGHWAEDWIEALKTDGVTSGCLVGFYCPESSVTRAQMAVFLLKATHGSAYAPPAVGVDTGFTDVAIDYWAAAWIKQLAAEAITGGCAAGVYCPENAVTRAQMAVFLVKAFSLP